jgi:hypothetical protein
MIYFDIGMFKDARFGDATPTAFTAPIDRDDPYPQNHVPNDGKAYRITRFMHQGLPGDNADISSPGGRYSRNDLPLEDILKKPLEHPYSSPGDPDLPFSNPQEEGDKTQYGDGGYAQQFYDSASPLSRRDTINRLDGTLKNQPYDRKPLTSQMNVAKIQKTVRDLTKAI